MKRWNRSFFHSKSSLYFNGILLFELFSECYNMSNELLGGSMLDDVWCNNACFALDVASCTHHGFQLWEDPNHQKVLLLRTSSSEIPTFAQFGFILCGEAQLTSTGICNNPDAEYIRFMALFLNLCCQLFPRFSMTSRYLGGSLHLQSLPGVGTCAYLYLKRLESEAREELPTRSSVSSCSLVWASNIYVRRILEMLKADGSRFHASLPDEISWLGWHMPTISWLHRLRLSWCPANGLKLGFGGVSGKVPEPRKG